MSRSPGIILPGRARTGPEVDAIIPSPISSREAAGISASLGNPAGAHPTFLQQQWYHVGDPAAYCSI